MLNLFNFFNSSAAEITDPGSNPHDFESLNFTDAQNIGQYQFEVDINNARGTFMYQQLYNMIANHTCGANFTSFVNFIAENCTAIDDVRFCYQNASANVTQCFNNLVQSIFNEGTWSLNVAYVVFGTMGLVGSLYCGYRLYHRNNNNDNQQSNFARLFQRMLFRATEDELTTMFPNNTLGAA